MTFHFKKMLSTDYQNVLLQKATKTMLALKVSRTLLRNVKYFSSYWVFVHFDIISSSEKWRNISETILLYDFKKGEVHISFSLPLKEDIVFSTTSSGVIWYGSSVRKYRS